MNHTSSEKSRKMPGFKSIRSTIYMTTALILLIIIIAVILFSTYFTRRTIFDNSVTYNRTITSQINQNIDSYLDYMENIASMVLGSDDVHNYFYGADPKEESADRILTQFETILSGRMDIRNIGIVTSDGRGLVNSRDEELNPDVDISRLDWFERAAKEGGKIVISSSHVQHIVKGEWPWVITLSRRVSEDGAGDAAETVFFMDLNYSSISDLCDRYSIGDKGYVFVLDDTGNIIYHPAQQQLYNELQTENISLVENAPDDTISTGNGSNDKLYTISRSEKTGWTVVCCASVGELLAEYWLGVRLYVCLAVVLLLFSLLIFGRISDNITRPISGLRDSMLKVEEGDFATEDLPIPSENEVGDLTEAFNHMKHRILELMDQNTREQEEKRRSELKALQSQINPHFLYNTLDSIIWMAEGKKNEEVVLMTASLARLLRQSISSEDELVPISREAEYARSYLTIQKMRYKDKLEFEIDISPEIASVMIIKLVLQPIIENAIYHGLKYKEGKGLLIVNGYRDGDKAVIEIIDNGVGMDEETLSHIFERHKVNYQSNGVGVYNVQKRLQLYYGENYGITYESEPGFGTTASVIIPMKTEATASAGGLGPDPGAAAMKAEPPASAGGFGSGPGAAPIKGGAFTTLGGPVKEVRDEEI